MRRDADQLYKALQDADPRGCLHLWGALPLDAPADVYPLQREIVREPVQIDNGFRIVDAQGERIEHCEAFTNFHPADANRMADYAAQLAVGYRLPVRSTAILMLERYDRPGLPTSGLFDYGDFVCRYPFRLVRLWQLDASRVIAMNRTKLLPWVPLLSAREEDLVSAAERIRQARDVQASGVFAAMGSLRYDHGIWQQTLERCVRMIPDEIFENTWFAKEWRQRGFEAGLQEGRRAGEQEGRRAGEQEGRRQTLAGVAQRMLTRRFATLVPRAPAIGEIQNLEKLEALIDGLTVAADQDAANRLIDESLQ